MKPESGVNAKRDYSAIFHLGRNRLQNTRAGLLHQVIHHPSVALFPFIPDFAQQGPGISFPTVGTPITSTLEDSRIRSPLGGCH